MASNNIYDNLFDVNKSYNFDEINKPTYFKLNIYVPYDNTALRKIYSDAISKHNSVINDYLSGKNVHFDAGLDLFLPKDCTFKSLSTTKADHLIKCSMQRVQSNHMPFGNPVTHVGYYLYPRSSTGSKTPLRLSNSVGIIDSGYRGNIIAMFDNWKNEDFHATKQQRLVQICPPDLSYPIYAVLVNNEDELGYTNRGQGGFGSTGA